jgi:hypothetical protein
VLDSDTVVISFSTTFVFQIMTIGRRSGGDGLAFVVVVSKAHPRACLGSCLNLHGEDTTGNVSNHLFAVEFDTKQLSGGFLNETNDNHIGVDLNNVASTMSEPDIRTKVLNVTVAPASMETHWLRIVLHWLWEGLTNLKVGGFEDETCQRSEPPRATRARDKATKKMATSSHIRSPIEGIRRPQASYLSLDWEISFTPLCGLVSSRPGFLRGLPGEEA